MGSSNLHQCVHHQVLQLQRKSSMKKLNSNVDHNGDHHKGDQKDKNRPHVQFTTIEVRTHSLCIGDNPGGGQFGALGAPISLDWEYDTEHESYNLDEYEERHHNDHNDTTNSSSSKRRSRHQSNGNKLKQWQLILQPFEREFILIHKLGYTKEEINIQRKMIKIDRNQRKHTRRIMIFEPIEIGLEHFRKWRKNRNNNNNININAKTTKDEPQRSPSMDTSTSSSESTSFSCSYCQENK